MQPLPGLDWPGSSGVNLAHYRLMPQSLPAIVLGIYLSALVMYRLVREGSQQALMKQGV